jgi:hypothetical protein
VLNYWSKIRIHTVLDAMSFSVQRLAYILVWQCSHLQVLHDGVTPARPFPSTLLDALQKKKKRGCIPLIRIINISTHNNNRERERLSSDAKGAARETSRPIGGRENGEAPVHMCTTEGCSCTQL